MVYFFLGHRDDWDDDGIIIAVKISKPSGNNKQFAIETGPVKMV